MIKEKKIRPFLTLLLIFGISFFMSDADMFHDFGTRFEFVKYNVRLIWMLIIGDVGQAIEALSCSLIFFVAWRKNRSKNRWFSDLYWQLSGLFLCLSISSALSFISNFASYLWIQGLIRLFIFMFWFYFLNTLFAARKLLYYPEDKDETIKKAQAFDKLYQFFKDENVAGK